MDLQSAILIAEGAQEADHERTIEAWQALIDTGIVWSLQGFFGRQAPRPIEAGLCLPRPKQSTWG